MEKGQWKESEAQLRGFLRSNPQSSEATVLHALTLVQLGQPFDAVLELEAFLQTTPNSLALMKLYAELLASVVNDKLKAEEILVQCSKLAPRDVEIWKALGNMYVSQLKSKEAIRCFETATRISRQDPALTASLAYSYGQAGQSVKAGQLFERALGLNSVARRPDPMVILLNGEYLLSLNKPAEALPLLSKALLLNPHSADGYAWRGLCYEKLKDLKRAEADALAAIRESEKRKDAHQLLLRIYKTQNRPDKAKEIVARLQQLDDEEYAQLSLGRSLRERLRVAEPLLREGKYSDAVPHYEEIVKLLPTFYEAYFALGMCYSQLGRLSEAESAFKKYLSMQPLSADGNAALGLFLVQQGRRAEAEPFLKKAIELDPEQWEVRKALAQVHIANFDYREAVAELEVILKAEPRSDPELYLLLARSYLLVNNEPDAVEAINRGLVIFGNSVEYLRGMVKLLLEYDPRGAQTEELMKKLAQRFPNDAGVRTLHADWAYAGHDYPLCLAELKVAETLNPDVITRVRMLTLSGMVEDIQNNPEAAEPFYRQSYELNQKEQFPDRQSAMAYVEFLERHQRDEEAQQHIREILKFVPGLGAAHFSQAVYLAKKGQPEKAIEEAQLALVAAGNNNRLLQSVHAFMAKTYFAMGKRKEAQMHQDWIETNVRR
jgi:tetratricopeptide (TPR) repeat protein